METLRDLGIDTILVILVVQSYLCMMRYTILKVFATSWDVMSKVVCTKLKDMPNQLEAGRCRRHEWTGATNAITGIADAMSDSVPLLVFTGQVARAGIGKDAFQEADIVGITMPITKYNYHQVRETADIPRIITGGCAYRNDWSSRSSCD